MVDSFFRGPSVFVQNHDGPNPGAVTPGPVTLSGVLDYALSARAAVDDPALDDAMGAVLLEMYVDGSPLGGDDPAFRVDAWADAESGSDARRGSHRFELTIDPRVTRFGRNPPWRASRSASSPRRGARWTTSPPRFPLPAGLPAMAAALGALSLLRRRA